MSFLINHFLHNKKINLTGTAIGEFDFLVLVIRFFKILKYSAPYVPSGYFGVSAILNGC